MAHVGKRIERVARETFGWDELRPGQAEAAASVIGGRDTLAVMSTGYGKSAIYQIAALLIPGPTVVVSPLIALQREQVEELEEQGVGGAANVNSTVAETARREAFEELEDDALEFIFLSPEQLANEEVQRDLRAAGPSLFVVDEAHCISEWGHDFRPDYLKLGAVAEALGRPPILALTATASPPVREEIVARLGMRDPALFVRGFDRPNIWLGVERFRDEEAKRRALIERVAAEPKPGIVYAATRRGAEECAADLREAGVDALAYHGAMNKGDREEAQGRFMSDDIEVIVATTAFGMGVDKPDVRFVFHSEVADSVDSHYQEVGRAGRDGGDARAVLFYRPEDLGLRRFFAGSGQVDLEELLRVAGAVAEAGGPVDPVDLREETDLSQTKLTTAVSRLEDVGAVEVLPTGEVAPTGERPLVAEETLEEAVSAQENREEFDRSRIEMMRAYAELDDGCRRDFVLNYFGESFAPPCGRCDNCEAGRVSATPDDGPFAGGERVVHDRWGPGVVQRVEDGQVVVLFESVGYKKLGVDLVLERGLLEPDPAPSERERS
jgi:ATP-dependent DNA helicase RecQ